MKKDINYYRNILHKDTITLLIVAILFAVICINEAFFISLKSVLFIILLLVILCNKSKTNILVGVLAIITGSLMVITYDGSLFWGVYFLLGLFYIIHSIKYLTKLKESKKENNE